MHDLFCALLERYQDVYQTIIHTNGQQFSLDEPLDKHGRESISYDFRVLSEEQFEIALCWNASYPLWAPRTELYLKKLARQLMADNTQMECLDINTVGLRHIVTPESLSYEDDPFEQADMVSHTAVGLANIMHTVRRVVSINRRLRYRDDRERREKLKPDRLVELTLCSWKPNSSIIMC